LRRDVMRAVAQSSGLPKFGRSSDCGDLRNVRLPFRSRHRRSARACRLREKADMWINAGFRRYGPRSPDGVRRL
jgi:hypothetical protein